ncbi:DUF6480 family protein [Nesterenkonia lutea]|uniref:Heme-binding NEAT domain protein n=1 Tax=Nesterenkonia lutea TaxID=272919 RepID=A0ABR9JFP4_9MICC|nr:DUF6480 family protein [Nesterenkonia lutea]MBE1524277.1 heme-binding NEAT domain protein [Nesterenkonia lutea]
MTNEEHRTADSHPPTGGEGTQGPAETQSNDTSNSQRFERDETARNPNIDPEPGETPGTDAAGAVEPGDTPPDSNSATASPAQPAPAKPPKSNAVLTTAIIAIAVLVLLIFVGYVAGLIGG